MRLIDADRLKEAMYHAAFEEDSEDQEWNGGCWIRYRLFERVLDSIPTEKLYTEEEVARILVTITQDECACDLNGNDEWLPEVCECIDECPTPKHLECWRQWLKHFDEEKYWKHFYGVKKTKQWIR